MIKNLKKFALLVGTTLLISSCATAPDLSEEALFRDPIQYEEAVPEVYREPLYAEEGEDEPTVNVKKVIIHYYNSDKKNNGREIYIWTNGNDATYNALVQDESSDPTYHHVELDYEGGATVYAGKAFLNFIVKYTGTWTGQSLDTLLDFTVYEPDANGLVEVWTCPGSAGAIEIYKTKAETQMAKVTDAYFKNWKTIHAVAEEKPTKYRLYAYDKAYLVSTDAVQKRTQPLRLLKQGTPKGKEFDITFTYNAHINVQYVLETEYNSHQKIQSIIVTTYKLYNDTNFKKFYNYKPTTYLTSGTDLGCNWTKDKTTFKVWAPTAGAIILNIYNKGTPKNVISGGSDIHKSYFMTMQPGGVWEKTLLTPNDKDSLEGKYYTYTVYNSEGVNEICDPYAKACGVNGKRGMILDFSKTNPTDWDKVKYTKLDTPQRLSIYEVHIRDLTEDKSWGGTSTPGTYKAFAESGTRLPGKSEIKTGFDHIEEMNVKAVQIMPMFDYDNNELQYYTKDDGSQVYVHRGYTGEYKDKLELEYNWGYNPLNYNCVEGSYSSDPEDGAARVKEFKELVQAYANNKNNCRITMDVVYNHVMSVSNSNFTKLMPRYYFRFNESLDEYWNGSGCSNEVKSEAPMMRKFIIESLCWWASEYKVMGFRFDLMELIDTVTLNEARKALYKVNPDIYMYGEGWKAEDSGIEGDGASTHNVYTKTKAASGSVHLGCFNNGGRDKLKGGNDGGNVGHSNFYWDGGDATPESGSGYKDYPLNVGGWAAAGAEVWVHAWKSESETKDYKLTDNTKLRIYDGYPNFLLVRMPPKSSKIDWDKKWGQSADMTVGKGSLMFKDWGSIRTPGTDSFMSKAQSSVDVGQMATGFNCFEGSITQDPRQTVNYASCHDNFTLYDQFSWNLSSNPSKTDKSKAPTTSAIMKAVAATECAVALSNGVAFILGGDELLRTKVEDHPEKSREDEDYVKMYGTNISHNSYKSSLVTNAFDWNRKVKVTGYKGSAVNNTAWSQISDAFAARNTFTKFGSVSNSTSNADCNYFDASSTGAYVKWYVGGYVMTLTGNKSCNISW